MFKKILTVAFAVTLLSACGTTTGPGNRTPVNDNIQPQNFRTNDNMNQNRGGNFNTPTRNSNFDNNFRGNNRDNNLNRRQMNNNNSGGLGGSGGGTTNGGGNSTSNTGGGR